MIDFDRLVNMAAMDVLGIPVEIAVPGRPPVACLPDGSPLTGIFERSQKDIREENGVMVDTARPRLGLSLGRLLSAGLRPDEIDDEDTVITVDGDVWGVMDLQGPDSQGDVQINLKVLAVN